MERLLQAVQPALPAADQDDYRPANLCDAGRGHRGRGTLQGRRADGAARHHLLRMVTTLALIIGLVAVNLAVRAMASTCRWANNRASPQAQTWDQILLHLVPESVIDAMAKGECCKSSYSEPTSRAALAFLLFGARQIDARNSRRSGCSATSVITLSMATMDRRGADRRAVPPCRARHASRRRAADVIGRHRAHLRFSGGDRHARPRGGCGRDPIQRAARRRPAANLSIPQKQQLAINRLGYGPTRR